MNVIYTSKEWNYVTRQLKDLQNEYSVSETKNISRYSKMQGCVCAQRDL